MSPAEYLRAWRAANTERVARHRATELVVRRLRYETDQEYSAAARARMRARRSRNTPSAQQWLCAK